MHANINLGQDVHEVLDDFAIHKGVVSLIEMW